MKYLNIILTANKCQFKKVSIYKNSKIFPIVVARVRSDLVAVAPK